MLHVSGKDLYKVRECQFIRSCPSISKTINTDSCKVKPGVSRSLAVAVQTLSISIGVAEQEFQCLLFYRLAA